MRDRRTTNSCWRPAPSPAPCPIPGLAEHGIGFKTVEEAIGLRNHVLEQMDIASSTRDPAIRDAALTFVFVGGGYAGVEALGELEDMARYAARYYHNITPEDLKWILVEATDRILPEVGEEMGGYAVRELRAPQHRRTPGDPPRLLRGPGRRPQRRLPLPHPHRRMDRGRQTAPRSSPPPTCPSTSAAGSKCTAAAAPSTGAEHAWAAGDAAAVPDVTADRARRASAPPTPSTPCARPRSSPTTSSPPCAASPSRTYAHKYVGSVASLGLHKGVAHVYGRKLKGYPAWFMHRVYHLSRVPTFNRKARVLAEWTLSGLFKREIVSLGSLEHPRAEFELAAGGKTSQRPEGVSLSGARNSSDGVDV